MSENKINEPVIEKVVDEPPRKRKSSVSPAIKFIKDINIFGNVNRNQIVHAIPFILFVTVLLMCYISNSYYAEGIIRDIDKTKKELKEKRAEYITTMSRLMYVSNQSEIARLLSDYGVKESMEPPYKLTITTNKK